MIGTKNKPLARLVNAINLHPQSPARTRVPPHQGGTRALVLLISSTSIEPYRSLVTVRSRHDVLVIFCI